MNCAIVKRALLKETLREGNRNNRKIKYSKLFKLIYGEFDSGSERTLAAWIRHASRT